MELKHVLYEKQGQVAVVTINRPEVRNALHVDAHIELGRAFQDFCEDDDLHVAILTGAGDKAFCAGADLKAAAPAFGGGKRPHDVPWGGIATGFECWKPIIAAVNGFALGGGTELALACDMVVAADSAVFGLPEPRRGIVAGAGGVHRLVRQLPLKLAMELLLTGRKISAERALELGLVNRVVPLQGLRQAAEELAAEILECSPLGVRLTKELALSFQHLAVGEAIERQWDVIQVLWSAEDPREGAKAFAEKRLPKWTGH